MRRANLLLKIFVRPEIFVYAAFIVFTIAALVLNSFVENGRQDTLKYYFNLNATRFVWTALLFLVALFAYGGVLWIKALVKQIEPSEVFSKKNALRLAAGFKELGRNFVFIGVPFMLAFSSLSMALGPLNVFNATRLRDELLFEWDLWLTGTFPPLSLASVHYPFWFIAAVEFSFFYFVPVLTIFGAYLFIAQQKLFREAAGAFFLSLMIMFAGWTLFPVLSPHDRFLDNVYELPQVEAVDPYVAGYHPQTEIQEFLDDMRKSKESLEVFPTSAIPSAHVVWAVFLVYYSWRVWKWLVLVSVPFAVFSTFGTNLFAQHYFVDIPSGILAAMFSVFVAHWLREKEVEQKNTSAMIEKVYAQRS